jgi:putative DNA primase/helicase
MTTQPNNIHNLPAHLKKMNRWLAWSLVPDGDRLKKIPINIRSGGFAASDDPTTWCSFEDAAAYVAANAGSGIGFALGKEVGVVVVDFDKTRATASDEWPEWMLSEVEKLDSFTEVSASGRGMHVLCLGSVPSNMNRQGSHTEVWDSNKDVLLHGRRVRRSEGTAAAQSVSVAQTRRGRRDWSGLPTHLC